MGTEPETNLIVGGGQAGAWAAFGMREAGFAGRIVLIGEESHLPYERPPLSKQVLIDPSEPPISPVQKREWYLAQSIETLRGMRAVTIHRDTRQLELNDSSRLGYDRLLLATGARARNLQVEGAEHVLPLRTLEDARRIRLMLRSARSVICIGGGVVGLEIASSARRMNCAATVIEMAERPMSRSIPSPIADYVAALHRRNGVSLHFGETVISIAEQSGGKCVTTSSGAKYFADCVVAGAGIERNTELASAAGLAVDGGIVVDMFGRSSDDAIFGAGDVAAFWHPLIGRRLRLESWQHAQNHGLAIGRAMAGSDAAYADVPWFWTDQHGVNIQVAGFPDEADEDIRVTQSESSFIVYHLKQQSLIGATGIDAGRSVRRAMRSIARGEQMEFGGMLQSVERGLRETSGVGSS